MGSRWEISFQCQELRESRYLYTVISSSVFLTSSLSTYSLFLPEPFSQAHSNNFPSSVWELLRRCSTTLYQEQSYSAYPSCYRPSPSQLSPDGAHYPPQYLNKLYVLSSTLKGPGQVRFIISLSLSYLITQRVYIRPTGSISLSSTAVIVAAVAVDSKRGEI